MPRDTLELRTGPDPVDIHVGARIRLRRRALRVSQESLAGALGITFQQVQKYERGANRVSASKLHAIADVLGAPVAWFFDGLPSATADVAGESPQDRAVRAVSLEPEARRLLLLWQDLGEVQRMGLLHLAELLAEKGS
jgi:transcriptional regulator with XRE-family HTH domain